MKLGILWLTLSSQIAFSQAQYTFEDNDVIVYNKAKTAWQVTNLPIKSALIILPAGVLSADKLPEDVIQKANKFCGSDAKPQYRILTDNDPHELTGLAKDKSAVIVDCDDPSGKEVYSISVSRSDGVKCQKAGFKFGKANVVSNLKTGRNTKQCNAESWVRVGDSVTKHYFFDAAGASLCNSLIGDLIGLFPDNDTLISQVREQFNSDTLQLIQGYINGRLNCDAKLDQVFKLDVENKLKMRRQKKTETEKPETRAKIQSDLKKAKLLDPMKSNCEKIASAVHEHDKVRFGSTCQVGDVECKKDRAIQAKVAEGHYGDAIIAHKLMRDGNKLLRQLIAREDDLSMCCFVKPEAYSFDYITDKCIVKPLEYSEQK